MHNLTTTGCQLFPIVHGSPKLPLFFFRNNLVEMFICPSIEPASRFLANLIAVTEFFDESECLIPDHFLIGPLDRQRQDVLNLTISDRNTPECVKKTIRQIGDILNYNFFHA